MTLPTKQKIKQLIKSKLHNNNLIIGQLSITKIPSNSSPIHNKTDQNNSPTHHYQINHIKNITNKKNTQEEYDFEKNLKKAKKISLYDTHNNYRKLKSDPNLTYNWIIKLNNLEEVIIIIETFYPTALSFLFLKSINQLHVVNYKETISRQVNSFKLLKTDPELEKTLTKKICSHPTKCLKQNLWHKNKDKEPIKKKSLTKDNQNQNTLPILCPEPCNYFMTEAQKYKKNKIL